ncbi:hypothetical protein Pla100_34700 [Neorhodopirellula pilleata]|uniref:Uncharacterized protein n=2 Tax=Neorhodopirellula pilleata TaxID=2714738 RepID=A0A5C6A5W7_9BACT|nr:hypothetical protein Pla100_34700 [Neorhodopirellula pilleata]
MDLFGLLFMIVVVALAAAYPAIAGIAAIWFALATSSWLHRLAMLYATCLILGLGMAVVGQADERTTAFVFGCLLLIAGWSRDPGTWQTTFMSIGVFLMLVATWFVLGREADMGWIIRGTWIVGLISTVALGFRILGYRLLPLSPLDAESTMLVGTDKTWNEIVVELDRTIGPSDTPEQVHEAVTKLGLGGWTSQIEGEYLRLSGRIPIGRTFDGRPERVARLMFQERDGGWKARPARIDEIIADAWVGSRFSISQMMVWSAAIASFMAFSKWFQADFPSPVDWNYGPGVAVTLCLTSLTTALGVLCLPPRRAVILRCVIVGLAAIIAAPFLLQLQGYRFMFLQVVTFYGAIVALWQCFGFSLIGERGYRIVRIRT